jgi:hypothetical protein
VTPLEQKLAGYKSPSSDNEKDKQDRAERMVREAISGWAGFSNIRLRVLPKGSYTNNTNVRQDSDVDIAVIHEGFYYFDDDALKTGDKIARGDVASHNLVGAQLRAELEKCLCDKFGAECDTTGKTAITISEGTSRVSADVVPSFEHRLYYYDSWGWLKYHEGTTTRRADGTWVVNYPEQQHKNGKAKNNSTSKRYKHLVRILKRIENDLVNAGKIDELPSYFMECLVYRVPNGKFGTGLFPTYTRDLKNVLSYIYEGTSDGGNAASWYEPNGIKKLFGSDQKWTMEDARNLAQQAWTFLNLKDA